jgi:hypothetical protein
MMMTARDLTRLDDGDRSTGDAFAFWIDVVAALAVRYEQGAFDSYHPRTYWRGQSRPWRMSPGLHRRIQNNSQEPLSDQAVVRHSDALIAGARAIGLYPPSVASLGDMQLLAYLQHQGAATPFLDFTTDILTALAVVCFDSAFDDYDGLLVCYRYRPCNAARVPSFTHVAPEDAFGESAADNMVRLFHAPYLTARQRIQRGVFFSSSLVTDNPNSTLTITIKDHSDAIAGYYREHRSNGPSMLRPHPVNPNECAAIVFPAEHKAPTRDWLKWQHQLDSKYVYPEALALDIHREYIQENSATSPLGSNFGQNLF